MKIKCIYHKIDLDGWASAAIVQKWCEENNHEVELIGYNYKDELPDTNADILFLCDLSFDPEIMNKLYTEYGKKFIWIDHHESAINKNNKKISGIRSVKYAACELTWNFLYPDFKIPLGLKYLGLYDSFRHKNTPDHDKVMWFQYYARSVCNSPDTIVPEWIMNKVNRELFDPWLTIGKAIYEHLVIEAKSKYARGTEIFFPETVTGIDPINENPDIQAHEYKFIMINEERFNPVNFGIDYHADGYDGAACFYLDKNKKWVFSLYNNNGQVNCAEICIRYGGGGHKGAAGFITDDINQFLLINPKSELPTVEEAGN